MYVRAANTFIFVILKFLADEVAYIPIEKNGFRVKIINVIVVVVHTCVFTKKFHAKKYESSLRWCFDFSIGRSVGLLHTAKLGECNTVFRLQVL